MPRRPFTGPFCPEEYLQVLYDQNTFGIRSKGFIHPEDLIQVYTPKRLSKGLLHAEAILWVFYVQKTIDLLRPENYRSPTPSRPSTSLPRPQEVFYAQKTFNMSSKPGRQLTGPTGLLRTKDLLKVFYAQKTSYRSFIPKRPATGLLYQEGLQQVFYAKKSFYRPSIKRTSTGLLSPVGLVQVFCP